MARRVGSRQGRPQRNANALKESRMGQSSPRTVTPSTRGILPLAKAPSLWKDGVQRVGGEQSTQRTRMLSTRDFSWMPAQWNETRVHSCGGRRNGNRCFMGAPWRSTTGAEPCAVKAASTVLHGGDGETGRKALRPVPTQPGYRQRLTPSVRRQRRVGKNHKTMSKTGHTILMTVRLASVEW